MTLLKPHSPKEHPDNPAGRPTQAEKAPKTCTQCDCLTDYSPVGKGFDRTKEVLDGHRSFCFHEKCERCSRVPDLTSRLCEGCAHMRLGHILRCGMYEEPSSRGKSQDANREAKNKLGVCCLRLSLGTVKGLQERAKRCSICSMFSSAAEQIGDFDDDAIAEVVIYSFREYFKMQEDVALTVCFKDECTQDSEGNKWYGRGQFARFHAGMVGTATGDQLVRLRSPPPAVQWDKVSRWLEQCRLKKRYMCRQEILDPQPPGFRLIDTLKKCVLRAPPRCQYAALSYVWGGGSGPDLEATADNIATLEQEGSLLQSLPQTIEDAIIACAKLGVRYLWVDRLCILQDEGSKAEKMAQIHAMGDIYRCALVTLVAMAGEGVDYGLPGVSKRERPAPWITQIGEAHILRSPPTSHIFIQRAKWYTRGWTYQESKLSSHELMFTDIGVFYDCSKENAEVEDELMQDSAKMGDESNYQQQVKAFTKRSLTFESDILYAMLGVLNSLYGSDHLSGIPVREFDHAILWMTANGSLQRRLPPNGEVFPSWAWCSARGPITIPDQGNLSITIAAESFALWTMAGSLATWAVASNGTTIDGLRILNPGFKDPADDTYDQNDRHFAELAIITAWKEGCYPTRPPPELCASASWDESLKIVSSKWTTLPTLALDALGIGTHPPYDPARTTICDGLDMKVASQPGRVIAYSQALPVHVVPPTGSNGYFCLRSETTNIAFVAPRTADKQQLRNGPQALDVFALSLVYACVEDLEHSDFRTSGFMDDPNVLRWPDGKGKPLRGDSPIGIESDFTFIVNLMVVASRDGVSTRVGLARTFLRTWVQAGPRFQRFIIK
ncbi:HET domain-containing protein [Aspergillus candidus]|uniref:HET-domain-containing protein n=1 Tax=Aspergillus candidus TaxID=41067 RepID=A0A2I2FH92_ASPCN|nr:HET-domain-containing protein [Aspergillus candidus]PLB39993.1 HET-domain-containing protein [Aspergillus candidus]